MLTEEQNATLTRVGPGTPMGEVLRRYWHPIAAVTEFNDKATKPIRLMGEDLVLFRDLSGTWGLIARHCPHRGADLSFGYVEDKGLRCNYHGWLFDESGTCLAQPFEDRVDPTCSYRGKIHQTAYKVGERGGMLWAYMGPDPAPELPDWELFGWENGFAQIVFAVVPCNWLQCQENSIDPVHFEWMHANWKIRLEGNEGPYSPTHRKLAFEEFDYGYVYRRIRDDTDEDDPLWTDGRVCLWPNAFYLGSHCEWRVPIDDLTTLSVTYAFRRVPRGREPYVQKSIPHWTGPVKDERGEWIISHVMNQDFLAWAGQGAITDRIREHLGRSDAGIAKLRNRLLADIRAVAAGEDPKGLIRDPDKNRAIHLPMVGRQDLLDGPSLEEIEANVVLKRIYTRYHLQYGQPEDVALAYEEAMGFAFNRVGFVDMPEIAQGAQG